MPREPSDNFKRWDAYWPFFNEQPNELVSVMKQSFSTVWLNWNELTTPWNRGLYNGLSYLADYGGTMEDPWCLDWRMDRFVFENQYMLEQSGAFADVEEHKNDMLSRVYLTPEPGVDKYLMARMQNRERRRFDLTKAPWHSRRVCCRMIYHPYIPRYAHHVPSPLYWVEFQYGDPGDEKTLVHLLQSPYALPGRLWGNLYRSWQPAEMNS